MGGYADRILDGETVPRHCERILEGYAEGVAGGKAVGADRETV